MVYLFCFNRKLYKVISGRDEKNIFFISVLTILNGCAQSTSFVGPTYTMAKSGSILQAGNSFAASYGFKQLTGTTPGEYAMSFAKSYSDEPILFTEKERECQTFHSTTLSEIFFETLDGIDCLRDPFSILK